MKGQVANLPLENQAEVAGSDLPERWSAARKTEIVLRLIKGSSPEDVSREIGVSVAVLEQWRRVFVAAGRNGLKSRSEPDGDRELVRARTKIGELTMQLELMEELLLRKRGSEGEPGKPSQ